MRVTLTKDDVIEACREWVQKHYGFDVGGDIEIRARADKYPNLGTIFVDHLGIEFGEAPKPNPGPGGPYRTPSQ